MKAKIQELRESKYFMLMRDTFRQMTGLDIWLDDLDGDDPKSADDLASEYYQLLVKDEKLNEQIQHSHQEMRDSTHGKKVKYGNGVTGLIHFLVPIHHMGEEAAYLRCGGIRDSYRGVLKFINFSKDLRDEGYDEDTIDTLKAAFDKLPTLHGEDLAEAVDWVADRAAVLESQLEELA